jgi:hypothetical protein
MQFGGSPSCLELPLMSLLKDSPAPQCGHYAALGWYCEPTSFVSLVVNDHVSTTLKCGECLSAVASVVSGIEVPHDCIGWCI